MSDDYRFQEARDTIDDLKFTGEGGAQLVSAMDAYGQLFICIEREIAVERERDAAVKERDALRQQVEDWRACFVEITEVGRKLLENER